MNEPAYGTYLPNRWQSWAIDKSSSMPNTWLGKRLAFFLRRLVRTGRKLPFDIELFGFKTRLSAHQNVAESRLLFTPQYFDPVERKFLEDNLEPGFTFIDVGANIGGYTLFLASLGLANSKILAVEPQPDVFDKLTYNLSLNSGLPVKAIACALSDRNGEMTLFLNNQNKGQSSVKLLAWDDDNGNSVSVPCQTLLHLIETENLSKVDAIKLDVEGAEDLILVPFFDKADKSLWPKLVVIENERSRWATDCIELFQKKGYELIGETRLNAMLKLPA